MLLLLLRLGFCHHVHTQAIVIRGGMECVIKRKEVRVGDILQVCACMLGCMVHVHGIIQSVRDVRDIYMHDV